MTEPSQYFKGRTVQEQMNEVIGYVDTSAAEVATDAIASDVAQVHQDKLDADADAQAAAASAAAAAGTLANAVKKTGEASQSIAGDIVVSGNLSGGVVTGTVITAPTPVNNTDAATKKYVDDHHDATKLNISDVNSYAVGLTGNQNPVAGHKTFVSQMYGNIYPVKAVHMYDGNANWHKIFSISTTERQMHIVTLDYINNSRNVTGTAKMIISHAGNQDVCKYLYYFANPSSYIVPGNIAVCVGSNIIDIWAKRSTIHHIHVGIEKSIIGDSNVFMDPSKITVTYNSADGVATIPESDYTTTTYGSLIS